MAKKFKVVVKKSSEKKETTKKVAPEKAVQNKKQASFEEMLEQSMNTISSFEPGESVEAEILAISGDTVFLQLGGKSEGILALDEVIDKDGLITVEPGDTITAFFLRAKNGEMHFTTRISGDEAGIAVLESAFEQGIPVEGVVEKEVKGGFQVRIGESRAFCPYSQMGEKRVENPEQYIGKHLSFKITDREEGGKNIIVSNRILLEEEREKQLEKQKESLKEGMIVDATVISLRDFGAFVNVNGLQALLPLSEISRERVEDVSSVLKPDQEIAVKILKLDWQNQRISVSMKALQADPWDTIRENYSVGNKYSGIVARITNFGAFVTLEPGLDGLIHISDMKKDARDSSVADIVKSGETINVIINSIDTEKKRLSLKPVSSMEEDEAYSAYMDEPDDDAGDSYNPFAALLKKK